MPKMTPKEALDLVFYCDDLSKKISIRGYFQALLTKLFEEDEGFSGKRPFGNSGWDADLAVPLIKAGVIPGEIDGDGYLQDYDKDKYWPFVFKMIKAL